MNFRRATLQDLSAILDLQEANFVGNLSIEDRQSGFLSARFTRSQLAEMADDIGIMVADNGQQVLGFLCASQRDFNRQFPLLAVMLQQCDRIQYRGKPLSSHNSFIYGPVCIDRSQRGRGLLRGLYEALRQEVAGKYRVGVTFIAKENPHSLRAHVDGLGMAEVGKFEFGGRGYNILAFNVPADHVKTVSNRVLKPTLPA